MTFTDRYFNSNYNEDTSVIKPSTYDPTLCDWCKKRKIETEYMGAKLCVRCKDHKLDHESSGEKYDRYTSMGISHEEAVSDCYDGVEP